MEFSIEQLLDIAARQMHRGKNNVIRRFLAQLHNEFAKVGLDDFKTLMLQSVIEMNLLRCHRL